jgi:hypothetical protein
MIKISKQEQENVRSVSNLAWGDTFRCLTGETIYIILRQESKWCSNNTSRILAAHLETGKCYYFDHHKEVVPVDGKLTVEDRY